MQAEKRLPPSFGLITGSVNTAVFNPWIEQILLPNLSKKSVIVMDHASFHKGDQMQKMLADAGHTLLYLPPYSPDLTPIEKKWAQAKQIRTTARCSIHELSRADVT